MTRQRDLFDRPRAEQAREESIEQVSANADPAWKDSALEAVRSVALAHATFTTDDVWRALGKMPEGAEPRAMGGIMRLAQSRGLCSPLLEHRLSARVSCHSRPLRVWQSLLFRQQATP
jgi:hypothetical protein